MTLQTAVRHVATDESIQAAVDDANAYEIVLEPGIHTLTSQLFLNGVTGKTIRGYGPGRTTVRATTDFGSPMIQVTGPALVACPALGSAASKGDSTLQLSGAMPSHTLFREAIILHRPGDLWNSSRAAYERGEYQDLRESTGLASNEISLGGVLYDGYATSGTNVWLLKPSSLVFKDMTLDSSVGPNTAIRFDEASHIVMDNVHAYAPENTVYFYRCYDHQWNNCHIFQRGAVSGDRYALSLLSCQKVEFTRCTVNSIRHAVTIGAAGSGVHPISRDIWCRHSRLGNLHALGATVPQNFAAAADHHGGTEFSGFEDCTIYGEVAVSGANNTYSRNRVHTTPDNGPQAAFAFREIKSLSHQISDNIVECGDLMFIDAEGTQSLSSELDVNGILHVSDNVVSGTGSSYFINMEVSDSINAQARVAVRNNTFQGRTNVGRFARDGGTSETWDEITWIGNTMPSGSVVSTANVSSGFRRDNEGGTETTGFD